MERLIDEGKEVKLFELADQEVLERANTIAFMFPAGLMVAALAVFAAGKPAYALETPQERHELTPEERRLQWQTLWKLFGIFALVVLFWVGYEHNDNLWVAFIRDYVDLRMPFRMPFVGSTIAPDQLQFLNALFVVLSIPTFNFLFSRLDPKTQIFTPMRKILAGFLLTAASIGIMALAGFLAQGHTEEVVKDGKTLEVATAKVSVLWPAMAYVILTLGEVLLYGTMLELAYAAAPKSMKGFVTACFLTTSALGNLLNVGWAPLYGGSLVDKAAERGPLNPGVFFGLTALIVLGAGVAFLFIGRRFERAQAEAAAGTT
jgi:POT family proton-dependent oligopeptide transporter